MYKSKKYSVKSNVEIRNHISALQSIYPETIRRAFLADGDALMLSEDVLTTSIDEIKNIFPFVKRINTYASVFSLKTKTIKQLKQLKKTGLKTLYLGIESGSDAVLSKVEKSVSRKELVEQCEKASSAGVLLSVMIIIGLGGKSLSLIIICLQHRTI
jgi:radical SAM superfamily enzyme YgiQ (UPF0313 family)